jgi:hypothetical protein
VPNNRRESKKFLKMAKYQGPPGHSGTEEFAFTVGNREFQLNDPIVDARKILTVAGFLPADDHVLIQLLQHGSRSLGLDEEVDLRKPGTERFDAFVSDRIFNFTVDERGYEWGAPTITEVKLRALADVPDDKVLMLERADEPPRELMPEDLLDLAARGTEHLRTIVAHVTVIYNQTQKFELKREIYTASELMTIFRVPSGYVLDLVKDDGEFDELNPDRRVHVKNGMEFISHAPCGHSS